MATPVARPEPAAEPGQWQTISATLLAPATAMEGWRGVRNSSSCWG